MPNIPITQRVADLLALAADPGAAPDEARTAAFVAAKLIAQHGLHVVEPCDSNATATATRTAAPKTTVTWHEAWERVTWHEAWERVEREAREAELAARVRQNAGPECYAWVAKEPSECGSCAAAIASGDDCFYGPFPKHEWRCVPCALRNARRKRKKKASAA